MNDASLRAEIAETKAELQRLRERMSIGTPTVYKELSLIALTPKWTGSESTVTLEEFYNTETLARIGRRADKDQLEIAVLKLVDWTKVFY